jgi:hypothetical protein
VAIDQILAVSLAKEPRQVARTWPVFLVSREQAFLQIEGADIDELVWKPGPADRAAHASFDRRRVLTPRRFVSKDPVLTAGAIT